MLSLEQLENNWFHWTWGKECRKNMKCTKCQKIYDESKLYEIGQWDGKLRGDMGNKVIEIHDKSKLFEMNDIICNHNLHLCRNCLDVIGYDVVHPFGYCNLCNSKHEKLFYSDNQCDDLCGIVTFTNDQYQVECGYGSGKYDNIDEYRILFTNNILPDNITVDMNLCDSCITKMLDDNVLYKAYHFESGKWI